MHDDSRSLSACLVVRDAQGVLEPMIDRLLEAVADLTSQFEVVLVDDASHDATPEMAHVLASRYPQIRLVRLNRPLGYKAALRQGLSRSRGQVLLYADQPGRIPSAQLHQAWELAGHVDAVFARQRPRSISQRLGRESSSADAGLFFGTALQDVSGPATNQQGNLIRSRRGAHGSGFQMIRRDVLEKLRWLPLQRVELMVALSERGYDWIELDALRRRASSPASQAVRAAPAQKAPHTNRQRRGAKRPNYLDRLKRFALGE